MPLVFPVIQAVHDFHALDTHTFGKKESGYLILLNYLFPLSLLAINRCNSLLKPSFCYQNRGHKYLMPVRWHYFPDTQGLLAQGMKLLKSMF